MGIHGRTAGKGKGKSKERGGNRLEFGGAIEGLLGLTTGIIADQRDLRLLCGHGGALDRVALAHIRIQRTIASSEPRALVRTEHIPAHVFISLARSLVEREMATRQNGSVKPNAISRTRVIHASAFAVPEEFWDEILMSFCTRRCCEEVSVKERQRTLRNSNGTGM